MFDIGWSELMIIGVVALIVVGPKDLPMMFRKVGNFVGKARGMARDFQTAMDQAADESGIKDIADSVKKAAEIKDDFSVGGMSSKATEFAEKFTNTKSIAETTTETTTATVAKKGAKATSAKKPAVKKTAVKNPAVKKTGVKKAGAKVARKAPAKKAPAKKSATSKAET
ncbi:MAG: Sec-independent protein translocase protein TatB [Rhodobacterales bacterium]